MENALKIYHFVREAKIDFAEAVIRIGDGAGKATVGAFVEDVLAACERLAELPGMGRACPDLGERLRRFPVAGYMIYYRPMAYGIEVSRLLNQRRDEEAVFARGRRPPPGKPGAPPVRKRKTR